MKQAAAILVLALAATAVAVGASSPRAQARASLVHCRAVLATLRAGPAKPKAVPALKRTVSAARAACNQGARLSRLGQVNSDRALMQAGDAELGVLQGLGDYGKYLADIAAGKTGHTKILNYSLTELSQAKLLIAEALTELK